MTKPTITIKICCGTMCYIMGGAELHLLKEHLPAHIAPLVKIEGASCLGVCQDDNEDRPPCVMINDELIPNATIQKIITHITKQL
ncbi:hypothetical protein DMA11_01645 [Marinilabiliaceae bacterium JC017]|nr:hypothetical protein DMA11_01645 [Marinilabiliaceae bacterium JC017]